jgi:hypothetical protein
MDKVQKNIFTDYKDDMVGNEGHEKCIQNFGEEPLGRNSVDWRIILNWILDK